MGASRAAQRIGTVIAESLAASEQLTVSEWSDRYRVLSSKGSAEPGRWRTARTPYLREIMDCFAPDSPVQDVWVMKGAQLGFTEAGINCVGYVIDQAPGPMLFVEPTLETVKKAVKQRLDPLIDETPRLRERLPPKRSKDGGNALFEKQFPGGILMMAGANSAASLRSMPIRYLLLDEVDAYPGDVEGEGDPIQLAAARTRTFPRRKRLYISTPTIAGLSRIERGVMETDQRRYFVPCPHCGTYQIIVWNQPIQGFPCGRIAWDSEDLARPPWMECTNGCIIEERAKPTMLALGEWCATVPEKTSRTTRGYLISSLYSPYGWYSWADARDEFLEAAKDPLKLKTWINTVEGKTWVERGDAPPWERLFGRREHYARGTVPMGGVLLVAGADVQKDRIEVEIRAWGPRFESWSVDYLILEGDTADLDGERSPWRQLDELLTRRWPHESGAEIPLARLVVDSGYETQTVYSWARTKDKTRVTPIKGSATAATLVGTVIHADVNRAGKRHRRGVRVWPVGVSLAKAELYGWLRQDPVGSDGLPPTGWLHFPGYPEEWFRQLCAEQLVARPTKRGYTKYEWEKTRERNEALDCAVYCRAAAAICRMDRFTSRDWSRLRSQLGIKLPGRGARRAPPPAEPSSAAEAVAAALAAAPVPEVPTEAPAPSPAPPPAPPRPKPRPKPKRLPGGFWSRRGR